MKSYPNGKNNHRNPTDDPLVCAVETMRGQAVPDGPSPELEAQLLNRIAQLEDLDGLDDGPPAQLPAVQTTVRERTFKMQSLTKYAAAILIAGVIGVIVAVNLTPSTPAFADVRDGIVNARTMSFTATIDFDKPPQPGAPTHMRMEMIVKNPGSMRQVIFMPNPMTGQEMEMVNYIDYEKGTILTVMDEQKVANEVKFDFKDFVKNPQNINIVSEFTRMDDEAGKLVREETVDGRKLLVYEVDPSAQTKGENPFVPEGGMVKMTVWVDAEQLRPIRMEMTMTGPFEMKVKLKDFRWDFDAPDSLFAADVPDDYKINSMDLSNLTEKDLVNTLKLWAESNDNTFPDEVNQIALQGAMMKVMQSIDGQPDEEEIMALVERFMRGVTFLTRFMEGGDYGYRGKGVELGEAGRIVCYFREADEPNYRAVFGDLSVGELTPEDLKGRVDK